MNRETHIPINLISYQLLERRDRVIEKWITLKRKETRKSLTSEGRTPKDSKDRHDFEILTF